MLGLFQNNGTCPNCNDSKTSRIPRRTFVHRVLKLLNVHTVQCRACNHTFSVYMPHRRTTSDQKDLRRHPRVMLKLPATISFDHSEVKGTTVDVSIRGCGIECSQVVPEGSRLSIHFDEEANSIEVSIDSAIVRHAHARGFGAEFVHVDSSEQEKLQHLVEWGWGIDIRKDQKSSRI